MLDKQNEVTFIGKLKHVFRHINPFLLVIGALIIGFSSRIQDVLHWVVGSATLFTGLFFLVTGMREYGRRKSVTRLTVSAVLFVLGIVIMTQRENAVGTIMIIWGLIGLSNGSYRLFEYIKSERKRSFFGALEVIVSIADAALGVALLINPYRDIQLHIILLGIELIMISIKSFDHRVVPEKKQDLRAEYAEIGDKDNIHSIDTPHSAADIEEKYSDENIV